MSTINYVHTEVTHNTIAATEILPFVFSQVRPQSVLDIGCANGAWLKVCKDLGAREVLGVDGISVDKKFIPESEFVLHDLRKVLTLNKKFDLGICLEVAEHLPAETADNLIHTLTTNSDFILFSAAVPGQGGQYHINEQWPQYWHLKFKANGFVAFDILRDRFWNNDNVLWWYKQNMVFYVKSSRASELKFQFNQDVHAMVHPELYQKKVFHPKYLKTRSELIRSIWISLKYLIKSFF